MTTLPGRPQARHSSPASATNNRAGTAAGGEQRGKRGCRQELTSTPSQVPLASPSPFCRQLYVYTTYRDFKPTHKQPSSPKEDSQSWGQRDSCTPELCVQGSRQGAYLSPKPCSGINILNLSPGHGGIFTAKFPLVICLYRLRWICQEARKIQLAKLSRQLTAHGRKGPSSATGLKTTPMPWQLLQGFSCAPLHAAASARPTHQHASSHPAFPGARVWQRLGDATYSPTRGAKLQPCSPQSKAAPWVQLEVSEPLEHPASPLGLLQV